MAQPFTRLPSVPELPALEQEILEFWQRERVFDRLREQNSGGPRFGFFDGNRTRHAPTAALAASDKHRGAQRRAHRLWVPSAAVAPDRNRSPRRRLPIPSTGIRTTLCPASE